MQKAIDSISNALAKIGIGDDFKEGEYERLKIDPSIVVDKNAFQNMKDNLSAAIDIETAGLDNLMMKKMLLSYYSATYLDDTNVLIEIDEEDDGFKKKDIEPFEIVEGNEAKGRGEDGKLYLSTKGLINMKKGNKKLIYYPEETIKEIFEKHYQAELEDHEDYAKDVLRYLKKCYTYGGNGIKIFTGVEQEENTTYNYENIEEITLEENGNSYDTYGLTNIEYYSKISQYATPMEFMINLLEVTGSKDFVNAFLETVHNKTKIKMELVSNTYLEEEVTVTEGTRHNVVTGKKKENNIYTVKKYEGDISDDTQSIIDLMHIDNTKLVADGIEVIEEVREEEERSNVTAISKDNVDCVVILYKNNVGIKWTELNEENKWTYTWENLEKPDQRLKEKEDISKIIEIKESVYEEKKYDAVVSEVETWYAKIKQENNTNTSTIYMTKNGAGEWEEILDENSYKTFDTEDRKKEYIRSEDAWFFEYNKQETSMFLTKRDFDNIQYNYVISKEEENYNQKDYEFTNFTMTDTNMTTHTVKTKTTSTYSKGPQKVEDNTDLFLSLLSNETGQYNLGAKFKSKKSGGKVVKYPDIYVGHKNVGAGEMLENGAEMLFELLDASPNTQGLTDIMRYIMYIYSGKDIDYGVTDLSIIGFNTDSMLSAMGMSGFWWPIGSGNSSTKDTAEDLPVKTEITSGVGPRWGRNHGGIDIAGGFEISGPYIIAADSGTVTYATPSGGIYGRGNINSEDGGGYGNYVIIDHGNGYTTYYAHMYKNSITVSTGDRVEKGQVIGVMGSSGRSTGVHLHFEIRLNGAKLDPEEYVSQDNPRPEGIGGISSELYAFLADFEGGKSAYDPIAKEYTVFNNGADNNLELTCGVVLGTIKGGTNDKVKKVLGRSVSIGDKVTQEEYNKLFEDKIAGFLQSVESAIANTGAILTQQQKDAAFSLCWNAGPGRMKEAVAKFATDGDKGYWVYMHDITKATKDGKTVVYEGLVRRRGEEMEMFLNGDYALGPVSEGIKKHREYNTKYGLPEKSGE